MTDEELEKKAEECFNKYFSESNCYISNPEESIFTDGYKDGYKHGQEEIGYLKECLEENRGLKDTVIELKAQIEKMKCCENCKHYKYTCENGYDCDLGIIDKWKTYHKKCNKWELVE